MRGGAFERQIRQQRRHDDGLHMGRRVKISLHWPQRTQPSEMRSWSATTLNLVPQEGQQVIWLIGSAL